jgi:hypothetical protein
LFAVALAVVVQASALAAPTVPPVPGLPPTLPGKQLFHDGFAGADGVVTNHYAMWSRDPAAHRSPDWQVESGTLYRHSGAATTGRATWTQPWNVDSTGSSGNDIFRNWTKRSDFGDVRVDMRLRFGGYSAGHRPDWPAKSWDGVKIWLRRQGASGSFALYTSEVARRQGNVMIEKKCSGSETYRMLAQSPAILPAVRGVWEDVGGTVVNNSDGSVTIQVIRAGVVVLRATDRGHNGCRPIRNAGRVGVRGDNSSFSFDDFTVTAQTP